MVICYNSPRKLTHRTSNLSQGTEAESDPKLKQGKTLGVMIKGKRKEKKWVISLSEGVVKESFCRVMNEDVPGICQTDDMVNWEVESKVGQPILRVKDACSKLSWPFSSNFSPLPVLPGTRNMAGTV